jgi:hypothetical protein
VVSSGVGSAHHKGFRCFITIDICTAVVINIISL